MKYIRVEWPEIQDYMGLDDFRERVGFDPNKNCWFVPEDWESDDLGLGGNTGDLEDAMG